MQLTRETIDQYKREAPELLEAVDSGESQFIMKRDPATDYCVKFDAGWCSVQRDYGEKFLGDACHFFPRITRAIGSEVLTTMALSCPEAARLMLTQDGALTRGTLAEQRLPHSLKQYLPPLMRTEEAFAIHDQFVAEMGNQAFSAEKNLMRAVSVVHALQTQPLKQWQGASVFYFTMADGRLLPATANPTDPFNLLHALQGLISASKASHRVRLMEQVATICDVLGVQFERLTHSLVLAPDAAERFLSMKHYWKTHAEETMQPYLRRYLQAQMSAAFFPFAGLGHTELERMIIIGVRFATVKLALMAAAKKQNAVPNEAMVIRVIQSLSRFMDHLADPTLSMKVYEETGWVREPRLRALLME